MSDILYRPDLEYDKSYRTDGVAALKVTSTPRSDINTTSIETIDPYNKLSEGVDSIEILLLTLPDRISKALLPMITGARYMFNQINKNDYDPDYIPGVKTIIQAYDPPVSKDPDITNPTDNDDLEMPKKVFSDRIGKFDIKIEQDNMIKRIDKEYDKDLGTILEDYLVKLKDKINKFHVTTTSSITMSGVKDYTVLFKDLNIVTNTIENKELHHVADSIIRSNIIRDQKVRLFSKMYTERETITHIRACKIAKDLKKRYYDEQIIENNTFLDLTRNVILDDSRKLYDRKYKENLYNLYKYLNSSVILINECLESFSQEVQAKSILFKEGLNL